MPPQVLNQSYGKSRVRVSHIRRQGDRHEFIELSCSIELMGDFDSAYTAADNSLVVPTDTMKNTVYVLASRHGVESLEAFARLLATHFLNSYAHVEAVNVQCEQTPWGRIPQGEEGHNHAFVSPSAERYTCEVTAFTDGITQTCGLQGLQVLKSTGSAFTNYLTDEYTTLRPAEDRIFATTIEASWPCREAEADWSAIRDKVRGLILAVFANEHSESVQHTIYEIANAVLGACPELEQINLTMPNQHHLLANLEPFGLDNPNEVFVPTDEPFGNISATICREGQGAAP